MLYTSTPTNCRWSPTTSRPRTKVCLCPTRSYFQPRSHSRGAITLWIAPNLISLIMALMASIWVRFLASILMATSHKMALSCCPMNCSPRTLSRSLRGVWMVCSCLPRLPSLGGLRGQIDVPIPRQLQALLNQPGSRPLGHRKLHKCQPLLRLPFPPLFLRRPTRSAASPLLAAQQLGLHPDCRLFVLRPLG